MYVVYHTPYIREVNYPLFPIKGILYSLFDGENTSDKLQHQQPLCCMATSGVNRITQSRCHNLYKLLFYFNIVVLYHD